MQSESQLEAERQTLERAAHDPAAFAEVYETYVDRIYNFVFYQTGDIEAAKEITAETFTRALEGLPRFQWREVPYGAWLYRVATNMVLQRHRRKRWLELPAQLVSSAPEPEESAIANAELSALRGAIARLPADQRAVILLKLQGDLSYKQIGAIMNRSEGAIKALVFRAVTNLRGQLKEDAS